MMERRRLRGRLRTGAGRAPWAALCAAALLPALAMAGAAADLRQAAGVIGAGGGAVAGGGVRLVGTLGQPVVGRSRGAAGLVQSGFWPSGPAAGPTPTATRTAALPTPPTATAAAAATASATTASERRWVVTTTDDLDNGRCDDAHCSLREALRTANELPGRDVIAFAIPAADPGCAGGGPCTIRPATALPGVEDGSTTIDGYTQPGARPNTAPAGQALNGVLAIVLDGALLPDCCPSGVEVRGDEATVRGLVVHGFYTGIRLIGGRHSRIEGNYVGTDARGLAAKGNFCGGIRVDRVGDAIPRDHVIGGPSAAARNLLSGNTCVGLELAGAGGTVVQGNLLGADASGARALPNSYGGIRLMGGTSGSRIGGEGDGEPNLIAFNALYGVEVNGGFGATDGNALVGNSIHRNGGPGIVLADGGNRNLAAPRILAATRTEAQGSACPRCTVELFSDAADEGERLEGRTRADEAGNWRLTAATTFAGPFLTATATDDSGNTSAFAAPVPLPGGGPTPTGTVGATATARATATTTAGPTATARATATAAASGGRIWLPVLPRGGGLAGGWVR